MKVFLGGTCNESKWRETLITWLEIDYFNPVVEDWTSDCMAEERKQRAECDFLLYVITPKMTGVYSIAEVVEDSIKRPEKTIFCWLNYDNGKVFSKGQEKSLEQVGRMVHANGARLFDGLEMCAAFLNQQAQPDLPQVEPEKENKS